ncbi:MAG TPA: hypothetical protein VK191_06175 [Symbiobacteriaceae bacterium]|nr:hypothetical protein [Symbiobacteriaceae bacterium]
MRRIKALLLGLLMTLVMPSVALAHGGIPDEDKHHESIKAGPYTVVVAMADWPLKALKSNRFIVQPIDGIEGKSATLRLIPASPEVYPRTITHTLTPYPGIQNAWAYEFAGMPAAGPWRIEIEVNGAAGKGVAELAPVTVEGPPGVPLWLGWVMGLTPVYGLVWFGVREAKRVRRLQTLEAK